MGEVGGPWVLVDTGLPCSWFAGRIIGAAESVHGGRPPEAIILTHGHFDHAGNAWELAEHWGVPIFAHPLEQPYLRGQSDYPPSDPTMGGAIAQMSRAFPVAGYDLRPRVRELAGDGDVRGIDGWKWVHTPGHSPGHVSLWHEATRVLIAGDAVATFDLDSWVAQVTRERVLARPPAPFNIDWSAAGRSVRRLAELEPVVIAAGHGRAIGGHQLAAALAELAEHFPSPPPGGMSARPRSPTSGASSASRRRSPTRCSGSRSPRRVPSRGAWRRERGTARVTPEAPGDERAR